MMRRVISWLLVILWMGLIFYLSHQPAVESANLSSGIMERILVLIDRVIVGLRIDPDHFHFIIRKSAHFIAYYILGILVINALKTSRMMSLRSIFIGLAICVLFAISDEVHQLFVPGRAGQVMDVVIDSTGAIAGISGYLGLEKLLRD
ncbi:MAG TPA: VanZ family protein [Bacilli bacterium]|nr:VanZ family protein [Bacilli bacterium]